MSSFLSKSKRKILINNANDLRQAYMKKKYTFESQQHTYYV